MRQVLPPRVLLRVANILDAEADIVAHSYDCTNGRTEQQVREAPQIEEVSELRRFREYRRMAKRLRESLP